MLLLASLHHLFQINPWKFWLFIVVKESPVSLQMSWCNALLILQLGQRDTHPINLVEQGFPSLRRPPWIVLANLGSALMLPICRPANFSHYDLQIASTVTIYRQKNFNLTRKLHSMNRDILYVVTKIVIGWFVER
jgi:hypothetical protein